MAASVNNYYIGKGIVSFKKTGAGTFRDLGNVPEFEFTPAIEKLDHFSAREGVRTKDLTVVIQKSATVRLVMEEWTAENLTMALLGQTAINASGRTYLDIFSESAISGELKFVGTNDVGRNFEMHLLKVDFTPSTSLQMLSDEFGRIEINGDVAAVAGEFGTLTDLDSSSGYSG